MAYIQYQKHNYAAAQALIDTASRTNKQDPELILLKNLIYYKNGTQKEESVKQISKLLKRYSYMNDIISIEAKNLTKKG